MSCISNCGRKIKAWIKKHPFKAILYLAVVPLIVVAVVYSARKLTSVKKVRGIHETSNKEEKVSLGIGAGKDRSQAKSLTQKNELTTKDAARGKEIQTHSDNYYNFVEFSRLFFENFLVAILSCSYHLNYLEKFKIEGYFCYKSTEKLYDETKKKHSANFQRILDNPEKFLSHQSIGIKELWSILGSLHTKIKKIDKVIDGTTACRYKSSPNHHFNNNPIDGRISELEKAAHRLYHSDFIGQNLIRKSRNNLEVFNHHLQNFMTGYGEEGKGLFKDQESDTLSHAYQKLEEFIKNIIHNTYNGDDEDEYFSSYEKIRPKKKFVFELLRTIDHLFNLKDTKEELRRLNSYFSERYCVFINEICDHFNKNNPNPNLDNMVGTLLSKYAPNPFSSIESDYSTNSGK